MAQELNRLDLLIAATERSLQQELKLRELVRHDDELQKRYLEKADDEELLFQLVRTAHQVLESIKGQHLEATFEPEFLSEIALMSKPATKVSIPRP